MSLALSILAICISIAAFALSLHKHLRSERSSKFIQHRNALKLAAQVTKSAIRLRENVRSIDHELTDEYFPAVEKIASKLAEIADRIGNFDPMKSSINDLYRLESGVHELSIEIIKWESTIEEIKGFWDTDNKSKRIEPAAALQ